MVVVAAGKRLGLIAVRATTPRRRAVAAMDWAAAAGRGPVRAAGAVPALIFGVWFSVRSRRCRKVHLIVRVPVDGAASRGFPDESSGADGLGQGQAPRA